ncbi:MAG TPA: acyltransferase family protein [Acidimicrobiales bacterium]|nr:acyltransferase family protein [Acidimicrobiales bacterium]
MRAKTRDASAVSLEHVPGLDGIRGVAVLAIITTHTVGIIPGGFLSVDVFFALSGYLITSLLVAEWRGTSTVSLGRFWSRRARRLMPALFLMLTAVGVGAALWPQIFDGPTLRGDTLATVFYAANWHLIAEHTNYFAATGAQQPLMHTWSLAIEEQFYVVWPLVVLGVLSARRPRLGRRGAARAPVDRVRRLRVLFVVAVAGALASATWMAVLTRSAADTTRSYYGSDTRAQAILVGAALALGAALWGPVRSRPGEVALRVAGVAGALGTALLWTLVPPDSTWAFKGGFLVAAACTAAVIASVTTTRTAVGSVLAWGPLRYVGRISYGMYLWYWPMVLVLSSARTGLSGFPLLVVRLAAIVGVATLSASLVELPIRRGQLPRWWIPLAMPTAAGLAVLTTFLATVEVGAVAAAARLPAGALGGTGSATATTYPQPVKVLIVGDSVAGTLGVGLGREMSRYGVVAVNEGSPGCSVSMDQLVQVLWFTDPPGAPCKDGDPQALLDQWRTWVDEFNPDVVIYMARSEVLDQQVDAQWTHLGDPAFDTYVAGRFRQAVDVLGSRGAHVVLLTSPYYDTGLQPSGAPWPEDDPARVTIDNQIIEATAGASAPSPSGSGARSAVGQRGTAQGASPADRSSLGNGKVTVLDAGAWLSPGGRFSTTVDGVDARCSDGVHLTVAGGEWLARKILPVVSLLGRAHQAASPRGSWSGDLALTPPSWYSELPCAS